MTTRMIATASIDAGGRLRALDPTWVQLLAEEIALFGQKTPIRVAPRGDRFILIDGARRLAAMQDLCWEIEAQIEDAATLADDAAVRLEEIKGNMLRGELTALDHAVYVSAWCDIYQSVNQPARRGRKPAPKPSETDLEELSAKLALNWTEAAQKAIGISRRSVFRSLKIASIDTTLRHRIALLPVADTQSELLTLADLSPARQMAVVDMLTAAPPQAATVTEAIATLDGSPADAKLQAHERFHAKFSTLKPAEKIAFYELNADDIELWVVQRRNGRVRKVAA